MKKFSVVLAGLLAFLYLLNPTAGVFELIPDNIPLVGNLDEATATMVLLAALRYFGIDLTEMFIKKNGIDFTKGKLMRLSLLLVAATAILFACSGPQVSRTAHPDRWADAALLPVQEAQEHRDTEGLCALLSDKSAAVREAVALAFASVQDSASIPCLLKALSDEEGAVRATAAFALGFIADSLTIERMAELAMNERDSTVQRAYLSASFLAMQRKGMLKDPQAIIYYLESSKGQERVRAADALRRLPDTVLVRMEEDYLRMVEEEQDEEVKAMLVRGMVAFNSDRATELLIASMKPGKPRMLRINALRSYGNGSATAVRDMLFNALADESAGFRMFALEALERLDALDPDLCLAAAEQAVDPFIRIATLGLAVRQGTQEPSGMAASALLAAMEPSSNTPYLNAAVITAKAQLPEQFWSAEERSAFMQDSARPAVERQAMFQAMVKAERQVMMRSRYAAREAQYAGLRKVVTAALETQDAGLICAVAELLADEDAEAIAVLLPKGTEQAALVQLDPFRDLETIRLLNKVVALRDGLAAPKQGPPAFNHPIDPVKLRALKQGQRYRIVTAKGTIIIATEVDDCPGSSLAFDSLVTAGYYNGKAFHRMVPNFVAQGGCPRGDGYGGMPWTLRTEIGRKLFTAGSVGLASAGRDTESCQFFITHSATPQLDGRYTRFGEVVQGMDIVWHLQVGDVMERVERID